MYPRNPANRTEYQRYLASREWALKREAVRKRSGGTCERCNILPQDAVHHLTYEHIYNEPLDDLQAICGPCHLYESGKLPYDPIDVQDWAGSSAMPDPIPPNWGGPSWMDGDGWKARQEAVWVEKYGFEWEFGFIAFVLAWPRITNINPITEWVDLDL